MVQFTTSLGVQQPIERVIREAMRFGAETEDMPPVVRDDLRTKMATSLTVETLLVVSTAISDLKPPAPPAGDRICYDGGPPCTEKGCIKSGCRRQRERQSA